MDATFQIRAEDRQGVSKDGPEKYSKSSFCTRNLFFILICTDKGGLHKSLIHDMHTKKITISYAQRVPVFVLHTYKIKINTNENSGPSEK